MILRKASYRALYSLCGSVSLKDSVETLQCNLRARSVTCYFSVQTLDGKACTPEMLKDQMALYLSGTTFGTGVALQRLYQK